VRAAKENCIVWVHEREDQLQGCEVDWVVGGRHLFFASWLELREPTNQWNDPHWWLVSLYYLGVNLHYTWMFPQGRLPVAPEEGVVC
jgi:hypothetical protein